MEAGALYKELLGRGIFPNTIHLYNSVNDAAPQNI